MKILLQIIISVIASVGLARAGSMSKADAVCINISNVAAPQMVTLRGNGMTLEQMLNPAFFANDTPEWIKTLITGLIHEVYEKDWSSDDFRSHAFRKCREVAPDTPGHGAMLAVASGEKFIMPQTAREQWCYQLVGKYARQIAMRKWGNGLSFEQARDVPFPDEMPSWLAEQMARWVDKAYKFTGGPGEWLLQEYNACRKEQVSLQLN